MEKNEAPRAGVMKKVKKISSYAPSVIATKILIPLSGDDVAPRFDLAPEAFVAVIRSDGSLTEERTIILPEASAEALCHLVLAEKVDLVVCCGIEDEYYQYLKWKKVRVIDSEMGPYSRVLDKVARGTISNGEIPLDAEATHSSKK
jgi:predicted Fe-Mo cluster-binding NifX family protein